MQEKIAAFAMRFKISPNHYGTSSAQLPEFGRVINIVMSVFLGLVRSWQDQVDMKDADLGIPPNSLFQQIDARFKPLVQNMFFAKGGHLIGSVANRKISSCVTASSVIDAIRAMSRTLGIRSPRSIRS